MKRILTAIFTFFILLSLKAQVNAPQLRCISCNASGDLTLTWIIPPDPLNQFFSYEIYSSLLPTSGFSSVAVVATHTINTYTHVGAAGGVQSRYYYIRTHWGAGGVNTSGSSDTLRSIFLNLSGTSVANLNYNNLKVPALPSTASTYSVNRQYPVGIWSNIAATNAVVYNDTISICTVQYYYQIELKDNSGCISTSNISGKVFTDNTRPNVAFMDSVSVDASGQSYLGWNPSTSKDCIGYVVYQQSSLGSWIPIDTVFGINNSAYTYTSTGASSVSVNYCVASIDSCKNISKLGTDHNTIFLRAKYNICNRSADLTWTAYKNLPSGILKYNIYRSVNSGAFVYLTSLSSGNFYSDPNLNPGSNYNYLVRVVNNPANITSSSNTSSLSATAPPASGFVYLQSATVDFNQKINVTIYADTLKACKGFNILRSEDGATYSTVGFVAYTGSSHYIVYDNDVMPKEKSYYYKAEIIDSCGNTRNSSNIGKTILLKVKNDPLYLFNNDISWTDYSTWSGGVAGYYIFRVVNETPEATPINFVPFGTTTYTDNVEDIVSESGKVGYYVQAVENFGNIYGLTAMSSSNVSDAYVEGKVFIPNAFAPKGHNTAWKPVAQFVEKTDYHVIVFNRWGTVVFETSDDTIAWDGSGMEGGLYAYLVQYKNSRGEFIELKGTLTMLR